VGGGLTSSRNTRKGKAEESAKEVTGKKLEHKVSQNKTPLIHHTGSRDRYGEMMVNNSS
jgi:hypothetical protein